MKKSILYPLIAIGLVGSVFTAFAHDEEEEARPVYPPNGQPVYQPNGQNVYRQQTIYREDNQDERYDRRDVYDRGSGGRRLDYEVDHLNQMVAHVGREMRSYRADRHTWREYQHLRSEADQVNYQFRRGEQFYNPRKLRAEIAHMHTELHHIEEELHVPADGYFRW